MDKYDVLRKYFGYSSFRKGQEEMVDCLLSGRDALGIMPTGAGKPILRVTEMSYPVLKGKAKVKVKKTIRIKTKEKITENTVDIPLFNILKQIRYEIASKKGIPAFLIFSDASLTDMCRKLPVTPEEFLAVNGVGENKLKQYGDRFISTIAEYKASQLSSFV